MVKTLLGNVPTDTFLRDYWQKKPLLIRQAFPDIEAIIPADELAGLACEEDVESRLITQQSDGEIWQLQHGPFNEEIFNSLPDSHWTLLVQAVDHWLPAAAEFLQQFNFIPNWRIDDLMISYASNGGGVGPHYDNYDVFLVQAEGQRQWDIGAKYDSHSQRREDVPVLILDQWQAKHRYLLEPGDMLYIPPQIGHNGVAVGDGCMTYSVGFRAPSYSELFASFGAALDDELNSEDRYTDPDLQLQSNPGEISVQALDTIQKILQQQLQDHSFISEWFGRYVTEEKYPDDKQATKVKCSTDDLIQHQTSGGMIARNEGSRFAFTRQTDQLRLFVDGNKFNCDLDLQLLVEHLCKENKLDLADFANVFENKNALELIRKLVQQGSLYPLLDPTR